MQADPTRSSYPHLPVVIPAPPIVIPAKAGIQGMDTGFRGYDEENRSSGTSSMHSLSPSSPPGFSRESHTSRSHPVVIPAPPIVIPAPPIVIPAPPIVIPVPPIVIPAKAGIQGMDTGFRRYDEV